MAQKKLISKLRSSRSLADINLAMQDYLAAHNITTYTFTYYSYYPNALNKLKYDFSTSNFKSWHDHYLNEHYEEVDSTLADVYQGSLPQFWDIHQQLREAVSEKEKQMRLDSLAFGVEKGLSIPIHGPNEDFAIFLVVQMNGESCLDDWQALQFELFSAAYFYYFHIQKQLLKTQPSITKHQLNPRELQCLTLIAKQYSVPMIAKSLHITERTVNYHIQRLNKKLGTKNKYQSVAKALKVGIIKT